MAAALNSLCFVYQSETHADKVISEVLSSLSKGDSSHARLLLDAAELQFGPWSEDKSSSKVSLALAHLLILLCEDDLPAAKFLTKRIGSPDSALLVSAIGIYQLLWNGDSIGAVQLATQCKTSFQNIPVALKSLELLIARIQSKELNLINRAYSTVSVESFGKRMDMSPEQVQKFCAMPPDQRYEINSGFIHIAPKTLSDNDDAGAQIEKLANLVVYLEGQTSTFISSKQSTPNGPQ